MFDRSSMASEKAHQSVLGTKACRGDGPWQSSDKTTHVSLTLLLLNE